MHNDNSGYSAWIQSNGGPLLLLNRQLLPWWNGVRSSANPTESYAYDPHSDCDYNRACAVGGYLGLIEVGGGTGLVLGDEPDMTTWWPPSSNGETDGMLVRWGCADSETDVLQALASVPRKVWEPTEITFKVGVEPLCLFDSAYAGDDVKEDKSLLINLQPGSYSISIGHYRLDERTELLLHGFIRV